MVSGPLGAKTARKSGGPKWGFGQEVYVEQVYEIFVSLERVRPGVSKESETLRWLNALNYQLRELKGSKTSAGIQEPPGKPGLRAPS